MHRLSHRTGLATEVCRPMTSDKRSPNTLEMSGLPRHEGRNIYDTRRRMTRYSFFLCACKGELEVRRRTLFPIHVFSSVYATLTLFDLYMSYLVIPFILEQIALITVLAGTKIASDIQPFERSVSVPYLRFHSSSLSIKARRRCWNGRR